jgi:hypothetical protein
MKSSVSKSFFKGPDVVLFNKCRRVLKAINVGRQRNNRIAIYYGMDNQLVVGDHGGSWVWFHPQCRDSMPEIYAFLRGIAHVFDKFNRI